MQGWVYFGAPVMALMGMFCAVLGLVALFSQEYFTLRTTKAARRPHVFRGGWVHLLGGMLALAAGLAILRGGHRWARTAGIVVAALSAVVNLGFLAASPAFSIIVIALDIVVVYALTVHGWEMDQR